MAGGEIDCTIKFAALNFVRDCRGRGERSAKKGDDSVLLEDGHSELGKLLGVKSRVVSDEDCGLLRFRFAVLRDSGDCEPYVCEGEIVRNQAAPAGSAEFDGRGCHGQVF